MGGDSGADQSFGAQITECAMHKANQHVLTDQTTDACAATADR
jgi:hypothetical protein